jgi:pimeloyl-ACP methyl ester carboxylesterase
MTFVLVHGGGATGRFWDLVVPHLPDRVLAVDLPGRGRHPADLATITVADEVASVVADIEAGASEGGVVLVAHSSGGLVVPGVAAALGERVERIVLNAAHVPPEGGCGVDCMQPRHRDGLVAAKQAADRDGNAIILPGPPDDPERLRTAYGGDPLDDEQLAFVADPVRCVPDTVNHYFQPVRWSVAVGVPVTYELNERDRPIPPTLQEQLIGNLPQPPSIVRLDAGHVPAVTRPDVLAQAIRGELRA